MINDFVDHTKNASVSAAIEDNVYYYQTPENISSPNIYFTVFTLDINNSECELCPKKFVKTVALILVQRRRWQASKIVMLIGTFSLDYFYCEAARFTTTTTFGRFCCLFSRKIITY